MKNILIILAALILSNCATIVNDAEVPIALSFSNGSSGTCDLTNKRVSKRVDMPGTHNIRRSDDDLRYSCTTDDGKTAVGSIKSSIEGEKLGASVVFFDLGITDAITDKHRTYPTNFVVPVK